MFAPFTPQEPLFTTPSRQDKKDNDVDSLVSSLVNDRETQDLLNAHGLRAHSVTWEDTGRSKGSCWGPNISDMTLVTKKGDRLMPVIRKPNFSDVTDDVPIDTFNLYVGNEKNTETERKTVNLHKFLQNISQYTENTNQFDLTDARDDVVLTSSQCCVIHGRKKSQKSQPLKLA